MKLLAFQAARFRWQTFERSLQEFEEVSVEEEVLDAVIAFAHAEAKDLLPDARARVLRTGTKHLKWMANKRGLGRIVLHSFTHLGGGDADPVGVRDLLDELALRLRGGGYEVHQTPFGHLCSFDLSVFGESMAKVWKEI